MKGNRCQATLFLLEDPRALNLTRWYRSPTMTQSFILDFKMQPMLTQKDFNQFVRSYNEDYLLLLTRASHGDYHCLMSSFRVLKDLHDVILRLHEATLLEFQVIPYPLSFRAKQELLSGFGFDPQQIENIFTFLDFVKQTHGREFEECMEEALLLRCAK
jgi:hypothetical protein